ncbi:hypothetical protein BHX02_06735 [Campylobacter jejuni]|nr:hypothetical protein [Campylobacter jejuni]
METIEIVGYIFMFLTLVFIIACSSMDSLKKKTSDARRFNFRTIFLCLFLVFLFIFAVGIHPLWLDYLDKTKEKRIRRNANYGYKSTQTKG